MNELLLEVKNLRVCFSTKANLLSRGKNQTVTAVDDISFTVGRNEICGLVGESGSGKSTTGRAIMGLNRVSGGSILFHGKDLAKIHGNEWKDVRTKIQMVFQDPNSSLPPDMRIGQILAEPLLINHLSDKSNVHAKVHELLRSVNLPEEFEERYPHQLSGGQKQRIAVARAMSLNPEMIIADEPTSALDVSVQAQILNLLLDLRKKTGLSILFISHNLAVVRHMSTRLLVMQRGKIIEAGRTEEIFDHPREEYTKNLLAAIPKMRTTESERGSR